MTADKILDKLAKLKARAEGEKRIGETAAAEAFAAMINKLLLEHELSETDIPLAPEVDPIIEHLVRPQDHDIKFTNVRIGWQERLAGIVARAHLCRHLVSTGTNYITFVGTKSHVMVAEYAYVTLVRTAARLSYYAMKKYYREHCDEPGFTIDNYRAAWLRGFISRISERFDEVRRQEMEATGSSSTALIRLSEQLTRASQYLDDKKVRSVRAARVGSGNIYGQIEGRRAADKMNIGQQAMSETQRKLR